jgi:hypothetical protein
MLALAFIASAIVAIFYNYFVEFKEVDAELKTQLNGYVDWDNSIYLLTFVSTSKAVSRIFFCSKIFHKGNFRALHLYYPFLALQFPTQSTCFVA